MASKTTHASLWLPGFEINAPAYPDLFSSNDEAAAPAADPPTESSVSATAGIVVARSMCRSRFDDLHCLTTNDCADQMESTVAICLPSTGSSAAGRC